MKGIGRLNYHITLKPAMPNTAAPHEPLSQLPAFKAGRKREPSRAVRARLGERVAPERTLGSGRALRRAAVGSDMRAIALARLAQVAALRDLSGRQVARLRRLPWAAALLGWQSRAPLKRERTVPMSSQKLIRIGPLAETI